MRAHVLQHVPFEVPGSIAPWLAGRGWTTTTQHVYRDTDFPPPRQIDFLIILGGPMSANDEPVHPWLAAEKDFLRRFLATDKPTLGICLGAQLMAAALGATIRPNPCPEIGWFPIHATPTDNPELYRFPESLDAFHWHGETFDLPENATRLASSEACANQAFQIGNSCVGLQFHLETTPALARALIEHCRSELQPSEFVHSENQLLSAAPARYERLNHEMDALLKWLTEG